MTVSLLLLWFPIVLAVGVGGRLLGRRRGYALGTLSALFWIALVQASTGGRVWKDPWVVATVLLGGVAILLMGGWAGEMATAIPGPSASRPVGETGERNPPLTEDRGLDSLATLLHQFDDWLEDYRHSADPWPEFGEFMRRALYDSCRATHVKLYRLTSEGEELFPLHEPDSRVEAQPLSARKGILGHVMTTGRSFLQGDRANGELIGQLAQQSGAGAAWCFAVSQNTKRVGAVAVGHLDLPPAEHKPLLRAVEQAVCLCWCTLSEACHSRQADRDDPGSGLLNRTAFLETAARSLRDSYALGEPVAVAMIALEGLRDLNDSGRWELADELVREAAGVLGRKIRRDDCLGRFDGSRFIWLLRRVDVELAGLIAKQVMNRLIVLCENGERWHTHVRVRCGVVGTGTEQPALREVVCRALEQSRRARLENLVIAGEFDPSTVTAEAPA